MDQHKEKKGNIFEEIGKKIEGSKIKRIVKSENSDAQREIQEPSEQSRNSQEKNYNRDYENQKRNNLSEKSTNNIRESMKDIKPRLNKPISDVPTKSNKPINETQNRVKKGLESDSKTNLTKIDWEREYEETKKNLEDYHQQKKNLKEYIKRKIKEKESFSKHKDLERQLKFVRNEIEQLEKQIKELESINPTQKNKKKIDNIISRSNNLLKRPQSFLYLIKNTQTGEIKIDIYANKELEVKGLIYIEKIDFAYSPIELIEKKIFWNQIDERIFHHNDKKEIEVFLKKDRELKKIEIKEKLERIFRQNGNYFYQDGQKYICRDIELLKNVYERELTIIKAKEFLENNGCTYAPNHRVLARMLKESFKSSEDYETWKRNAKFMPYLKIIKARGGEYLSDKTQGSKSLLKVKCLNKHIFKMRADAIKAGQWCPKCWKEISAQRIEEAEDYAIKRGGECLSVEIKDSREKLKFRCKYDHEFDMRLDSVRQGKWCPHCKEKYREQVCRGLFETIFNKKFYKARPDWLKNENGQQLELDGYNKEIKLAFETQGKQHYEYPNFFHKTYKDFLRQQDNDKIKRELNKQNGVILIEIPYWVDYKYLQDYAIKSCKEKGFDIPENKQNIDWEKFKWLKSYNLEKKARIHEIKSQIENLIKEKGYFFRNYGSEWDCQDIELLKKIYETESSYNATKNSLENIGIESVPSRKTLYRMVRRSFKSEENYKSWKNQAKVKIFHRITSKEET